MTKNFKIAMLALLIVTQGVIAAEITKQPLYDHVKINRQKSDLAERIFNQIKTDPLYQENFYKIYNEKINIDDVIDAMTEYQHFLNTSSRFDDYLDGNKYALTPEEIQGYSLFKMYGCAVCHSGKNVGGSQFKKLGVAKNYFVEHKTLLMPEDLGLYEVTKNTNDINVFKVPSLRNVAIAGPYYHDDSVKTLDDAVRMMGKYQLGIEIPDNDVKAIVAFLNTLTAKSLEPHTTDTTTNKKIP